MTALLLALAGYTTAQIRNPKPQRPRRDVPKVTYIVKADIDPHSRHVRADLEVEYRNQSSDTLTEFYFQLGLDASRSGGRTSRHLLGPSDDLPSTGVAPSSGYCRIDSILFLGAPIKDSLIQANDGVLRIIVPRPILPGRVGFFLIAFESYLPDKQEENGVWQRFVDWQPLVGAYRDGVWHRIAEPARFNVALIIDSLWSVAHPGLLLNDKEHFGFLPESGNDTIHVDLHGVDLAGAQYYPSFDGGRKRYFIVADNLPAFEFAVTDEYITDRAYVDSLTIDVCYTSDRTERWQRSTAIVARRMVAQLQARLGPPPFRHLTIVAGDASDYQQPITPLITVGDNIDNEQLLAAALAARIAALWFRPVLDDEAPQHYLSGGLGWFTAAMVLKALYGDNGWSMLEEYERPLRGNSTWNRDRFEYQFRRIPAALWALRFAVGDEQLWDGLRRYVKRFRSGLPTMAEFNQTVGGLSEGEYARLFDPANGWHTRYDPAIRSVQIDPVTNGYRVRYEITCADNLCPPLEIGFVTNGTDTIYDTLGNQSASTGSATLVGEIELKMKPRLVLLDPNHYLPDINRQNNYYSEPAGEYEYQMPENVFPALKPF